MAPFFGGVTNMRDKRVVPVDTFRRAIGVLREGRGLGDERLHKLVEDHERYTTLVSIHEQTGGRSTDLDKEVEKAGLDLAIRLIETFVTP